MTKRKRTGKDLQNTKTRYLRLTKLIHEKFVDTKVVFRSSHFIFFSMNYGRTIEENIQNINWKESIYMDQDYGF
jgi:hypothetical protein